MVATDLTICMAGKVRQFAGSGNPKGRLRSLIGRDQPEEAGVVRQRVLEAVSGPDALRWSGEVLPVALARQTGGGQSILTDGSEGSDRRPQCHGQLRRQVFELRGLFRG